MDDKLGWQQCGGEWYRRSVMIGTTRLLVDTWALSDNEWAYVYNGGKTERVVQPTPEKAMAAVDTILAAYLRDAARALKKDGPTKK